MPQNLFQGNIRGPEIYNIHQQNPKSPLITLWKI